MTDILIAELIDWLELSSLLAQECDRQRKLLQEGVILMQKLRDECDEARGSQYANSRESPVK